MTNPAVFNLSEKRKRDYEDIVEDTFYIYSEKDVKEFIRRLKEELCFRNSVLDDEQENWVSNKIDKLAGKNLK